MEARSDPTVDPTALDAVVATTLTGLALNDETLRRLHRRGFEDLRTSHGFVFQHLVARPLPVGALARRCRRRSVSSLSASPVSVVATTASSAVGSTVGSDRASIR